MTTIIISFCAGMIATDVALLVLLAAKERPDMIRGALNWLCTGLWTLRQ